MSQVTKQDIEEFGITEKELGELLKFPQNVVDFAIGLKRLSKNTGVTIASMDLDCANICLLPEYNEIYVKSIAVVTPKSLEFMEYADSDAYKR